MPNLSIKKLEQTHSYASILSHYLATIQEEKDKQQELKAINTKIEQTYIDLTNSLEKITQDLDIEISIEPIVRIFIRHGVASFDTKKLSEVETTMFQDLEEALEFLKDQILLLGFSDGIGVTGLLVADIDDSNDSDD